MTLDHDALHPARRQYVLKLDRRAEPGRGALSGRVENLATGQAFEFGDIESLLAGLARELAASPDRPGD